MTRRLGPACLLIGSLLLSATARADDVRSIDVAKKSYEEGLALYKNNDIEGARLAFAQSYAAWPAIETLRSLAIAEFDTGRCLDSLKHFKVYLWDRNADPVFRNKVPAYIDQCNARVGHLRIVAPAGASILVDGHRVFDLRAPIDVEPGAHAIEMREPSPGGSRSPSVKAGETIAVTFLPAPEPPQSTDAPHAPPPEEDRFWNARTTWTLGLASAAVVSATVATGFGFAANSARSSYDDLHGQLGSGASTCSAGSSLCADLASKASSQRSDAHVADVTLGVAAAFAVSAAVVYFAWPKSERAGAALTPAVSQDGAGLLATGHF